VTTFFVQSLVHKSLVVYASDIKFLDGLGIIFSFVHMEGVGRIYHEDKKDIRVGWNGWCGGFYGARSDTILVLARVWWIGVPLVSLDTPYCSLYLFDHDKLVYLLLRW